MHLRTAARLLAVVGVTYVALELTAVVAFPRLTGRPLDRRALASEREQALALIESRLEGGGASQGLYQLHPYVGYIGRPGARPWGPNQEAFNDWGMLSAAGHTYPYHKSDGEFVVAVLGGSVAEGFANIGADALVRSLAELDAGLAERPIVVLTLATGGFKQPQQLMLLEYALLSGFDIDAAINLGGYNEVVLAGENIERGIAPALPSAGHFETLAEAAGPELEPETVRLLGAIFSEYASQARLIALANRPPLSYSPLANLVAERRMAAGDRRLRELNRSLLEHAARRAPAAHAASPADAADPLGAAVRIWSSAARMMYAVCRASSIVCVHALQPNQYYEGSKTLTDHEREVAYSPDNPWSIRAREGYPRLVAEGRRLRAMGLPFYDLTMAFRDFDGSLYTDDCCHFSPAGNEILARELARALANEIVRQGSPAGDDTR